MDRPGGRVAAWYGLAWRSSGGGEEGAEAGVLLVPLGQSLCSAWAEVREARGGGLAPR